MPSTSNDRSPSAHETVQSQMARLAELHPTYSLLQVLELLHGSNWQMEELTDDQKEAYRNMNAQKALNMMRSAIDQFDSKFALNSPPRTRQWLATGEHLRICDVVSSKTIGELLSSCDRLLDSVGTPPVKLFEHPDIIHEAELQSIARAALAALPDALPASSQPVILKKRTALRRTFPPSRLQSNVGNANNQSWHQDSNARYNDSPMLTLWIPLQDGSGMTSPGLQVVDSPVSYFSIEHGDSSPDLLPFLSELFPNPKIVSIQASAGDCIVFNGLTFHRTFTTSSMVEHRDALLVRVLDRKSAHRFPVLNQEEDLLSIV